MFSKSKLKRFNEIEDSGIPPVGTYDPHFKKDDLSVVFDKSDRFKKPADVGFPVTRTVSKDSLSDTSARSTPNATPKKKSNRLNDRCSSVTSENRSSKTKLNMDEMQITTEMPQVVINPIIETAVELDTGKLQDKNLEIEKLRKENYALRYELEENTTIYYEDKINLEQQVKLLLSTLRNEIGQLENLSPNTFFDKIDTKITETVSKLNKVEDNFNDVKIRLSNNVSTLENEKKKLEELLQSERNSNEANSERLNSVNTDYEEALRVMNDLKEEVCARREISNHVEIMKSELEDAHLELKRMKDEIRELSTALILAKKQKMISEEELSLEKEKYETLEQLLQTERETNEAQSQRLESVNVDYEEALRVINDLKEEVCARREISNHVEIMMSELDDAHLELKRMKDEICELSTALSLAKKQKKIRKQVEEELSLEKEKHEKLEKLLQAEREANETQSKSLTSVNLDYERALHTIDNLKEEITAWREMSSHVDIMKSELNDAHLEVKRTKEEVYELSVILNLAKEQKIVNETLEEKLNLEKALRTEVEEHLTHQTDIRTALEEKVKADEVLIQKLNDKILELETSNDQLVCLQQSRYDELEKCRESLAEKKSAHEELTNKYLSNQTFLEAQIKDLVNQISLQSAEVNKLNAKEKYLQSEVSVAEDKYQKMEKEYSLVIRENRKKIVEAGKEIDYYKTKYQEARNEEALQSLAANYETKLRLAMEGNKSMNEELLRWKQLYEDLNKRIAPFKEQLDAYEIESKVLKSDSKESAELLKKMGDQLAKLAGHHNHRQRIRYLENLKEELFQMKEENTKLRMEVFQLRKHNPHGSTKKFDPKKAFKHVKENDYTPLRDSNRK